MILSSIVLTVFFFTVSVELDEEYRRGTDVGVLTSILFNKHQNESAHRTETTTQQDQSAFVCPRCCKIYQLYHSLRRHMRVECGQEPRHACPNCNRRFKHRFNLLVHMRNFACRKE